MSTLDSHGSPWRKHKIEHEITLDIEDIKKPRLNYYRLESESSKASDDGTESICSLQDRETDFVQDSSDLSSDSEEKATDEGSEYDVQFEYEVASLSENDETMFEGSTTDSEDLMLAAAAAVICQNSFEGCVTDIEDSESSTDESLFKKLEFLTCVQCKRKNVNPMYRYCEKCFKDRKKSFPPRPKRRRNRLKKVVEYEDPKTLKTSESQGSEQLTSDLGSEQVTSDLGSEASGSALISFSSVANCSSSSGFFSENNPRSMQNKSSFDKSDSDLCIFCNSAPKNSIFLHTNIAHCCCCYPCAKKTLRSIKKCPICNGSVNKVVRIFTT
ncbi:E3 ubiquitin-protein ligase Mdm2-like [Anthonomus grandis grandis]|uniref:E3 ubiquitin-protein ligase Mdm2-like n=1 Tax=Anthonomus grandis grandis TaxID=2921223 RepID=UPI002166BA64|nr:E3 ubiquitin-protein ligase Mdm2-like [Anthonomus grandis grandis]